MKWDLADLTSKAPHRLNYSSLSGQRGGSVRKGKSPGQRTSPIHKTCGLRGDEDHPRGGEGGEAQGWEKGIAEGHKQGWCGEEELVSDCAHGLLEGSAVHLVFTTCGGSISPTAPETWSWCLAQKGKGWLWSIEQDLGAPG